MADEILHTTALQLRVTGSGNLDSRLIGLYEEDPDIENPPTQDMATIPMQTATSRLAQLLANFEEQYTQFEVSVDEIDEYFYITKITFYVKPVATEYPM